MVQAADRIVVYGARWCPDCRRAKQFLGEQRIQYQWLDIEHDPEAMQQVLLLNRGRRTLPTIVFPDGAVLAEPTNSELAQKLGVQTSAKRTFYDVIIVGGGPAGLAAAIYTSREGLDTLVMERETLGGQAGVTSLIENYPGFDEGISGQEFGARLARQAQRFGAEILLTQTVSGLRADGAFREIITAEGDAYGAKAVLLATGARYRRLEVPGEEELIGVNVHFCATCDGAFYRDKEVLVLGGGNSAFEEALFLTRHVAKITIATHGPNIKASQVLQEKVAGRDDITVLRNRVVQGYEVKDGRLAGVRVSHREDGTVETWHPDGVFCFIGLAPNSDFVPKEIARNPAGFIITTASMETTMPGVLAAGDVRQGATAQAASAAGEGAAAALMIRDYIARQG